MRWGYRVLTLAAVATLVVTGCSGDDGQKASEAATSSSTSSSSTSTSSTSTTVAPVDSTAATTAAARSTGKSSTKTTRAVTVTTLPATTTTRATCLATAASSAPSYGADKPDDPTPATVTIGNQHTGSVIVTLRGASYTIGAGGSKQVSLEPLHHSEMVTAAAASKPGDRFSYSVTLLPHSGYTLNVKTMDIGTCNAAGVRQPVYLRQDGFQGGL